MTNGWVDMKNTDMMLIMGGNPAENHPCGFKWPIEAKRTRAAKIISVDPRFTRTSAVADLFCQIRAGSDIAFLGGVINYAIQNNRIAKEYLVNFTNAAFVVKGDFKLPADTDGVFSGFDAGNGRAHHRYPQGPISQSRRTVYLGSKRRRHEEGQHDYLRRRLDPAQLRHANYSHRSDAAIAPRKRRARWRRRQRFARTLKHSGRYRHGRPVRHSAGLFEGAHA